MWGLRRLHSGKSGGVTLLNFYATSSKSAPSSHLLPLCSTISRGFAVSIQTAKEMPKTYNQMHNDLLLSMAILGDPEARKERLVREIMAVDNVEWPEAEVQLQTMIASSKRGFFFATLPQRWGIVVSVTAAFASIPLIFDLDTVLWFNEAFVTADVPEDRDLETPLEVSIWSWQWMEPVIVQVSFFLLCMQYSRAQLKNLGARRYTQRFRHKRAARLVREYPQYNNNIVSSYFKSM